MELTLDQALKKAVEAHEADNLRQAEKYYTAILRIKPAPKANYNMGVLKKLVLSKLIVLYYFSKML